MASNCKEMEKRVELPLSLGAWSSALSEVVCPLVRFPFLLISPGFIL